VLAGLLVMITTGCGARWDDEQRAQVLSRGEVVAGPGEADHDAGRRRGLTDRTGGAR
jgi:hypothetical protein